jgi:geranylgeranyl transferase type-2 subunit alpha
MHGQKRSEYKSRLLNPDAASKLATKAQQWNALSHELLSQRRRLFEPPSDGVDAPSPKMLLTLTEKMLSVNPDPSHLWNIRREMLLHLTKTESSNFDVQPELTLTAHCLQRNPKAYASWFHRKWSIVCMISHGQFNKDESEQIALTVLQTELDLCAQFLVMDERNFHCWNYRRFVVALLGSRCDVDPALNNANEAMTSSDNVRVLGNFYNGAWTLWLSNLIDDDEAAINNILMGAQVASRSTPTNSTIQVLPLPTLQLNDLITSEWNFTSAKIQDNFSNGSAFHYRSKLLPIVLGARLATDDTADNVRSLMKKHDAILTLAREEWEEILLNAIFTEPDDQTPWWYHRFIVSWAKPPLYLKEQLGDNYSDLIENYQSLLYDMANSLRELLEVEKENGMDGVVGERDESKGAKCKWAYLGLHLVLSSLIKMQFGDCTELLDEARENLNALIEIDPCRSDRYKMLANGMSV